MKKRNMNRILIFVVSFVFLIGLGGSVSAVTPVSSCTTITSPGVYVLTQDLTSASTCIAVRSSDVIFDGADYSITGTGSKYGIYVYNSSITLTNVTIKKAVVTGWKYGIYYRSAENGSITGNIASNNTIGIYLYSSSRYNTLTGNTVAKNTDYGIRLTSSSGSNVIYNNYFSNTNNAKDKGSNTWSITKKMGTNIIGGPYLGGNFWATPDGSGYSQTCADSDSDGICDSAYTLSTGNVDYLPLSLNFTTTTTTTTTSTTTTSTTTTTTSTTSTTTTTTVLTTTTTTLCEDKGCEPPAAEIPEFPTVAIPAILAIGGYLAMRAERRG